MQDTPLTFDQLPSFVQQLGRKVDDLTALLQAQAKHAQPSPEQWLSIEEVSKYIPGGLAITTIYGKVQRREIPFLRNGRRLIFNQADIDLWLAGKKPKTAQELSEIADQHITNKKPLARRKGVNSRA